MVHTPAHAHTHTHIHIHPHTHTTITSKQATHQCPSRHTGTGKAHDSHSASTPLSFAPPHTRTRTHTAVAASPTSAPVGAPGTGKADDPQLIDAMFCAAEYMSNPPTGGVTFKAHKRARTHSYAQPRNHMKTHTVPSEARTVPSEARSHTHPFTFAHMNTHTTRTRAHTHHQMRTHANTSRRRLQHWPRLRHWWENAKQT